MSNVMKTIEAHTVTIDGKEYKTHSWVMAAKPGIEASQRHHEFYAQFATPAVRCIVQALALQSRIKHAYKLGDIHFNTCNLCPVLDRHSEYTKLQVGRLYTQCCYESDGKRIFWSPSTNICILKSAMRVVIEENV